MDSQQKILALEEENRALRRQLLRYQMGHAIQDDRMSRQFSGQMDKLFPEGRSPWYLCILFFGAPAEDYFPETAPLDTVTAAFSQGLAPFGRQFFFESAGTVVCLMNLSERVLPPEEALYGSLLSVLQRLHEASQAVTGVSHIAVSRASRLEHGPREVYRGAVSASEHRPDRAQTVCLEPETASPTRQDHRQMLALEQTFWQQIQLRAFYDAAVTLDRIITLSQQEQSSMERTHASVFSRMELVLNLTAGDDRDRDADFPFYSMLGDLGQVKTFQEMREAAYDILATVEDQMFTPADARNRKMPGIERYIRDNYSDQNLGANTIADAFKISPSYLSRIFRADTGMGIVDYIHRIRVDAAKDLLSSSSRTMDEVAAAVGFTGRSALFRVFKKLEGSTPGAYRAAVLHES